MCIYLHEYSIIFFLFVHYYIPLIVHLYFTLYNHEVVLHKRNNRWYIWSCTSHDPIINDLDREINVFSIAGWPSDILKMRERLAIYREYDKKNINMIDEIYNKHIKNYKNI